MATTAHITETFGATAPTGGYTNESSGEGSVEKYQVLSESGVKVRLRGGKHIITDVSISGKGGADYAVVSPGAFTVGAFKALSAETTEHESGEYCDFAITGKMHSNVSEPDPGP